MKRKYFFVILLAAWFYSNISSAQTNHSEIASFMNTFKWDVSKVNNFRDHLYPNKLLETKVYEFDSGRKYAIVAFTKKPCKHEYSIEASGEDGLPISSLVSPGIHVKTIKMDQGRSIMLLNGANKMRLGVKINCPAEECRKNSELYYIIFDKT